MRKIKWTKKNIVILGALTVFALLVINIASRSIENDVRNLLEDCSYTVGTVKIFFIPNNPPRPYLRYKYFVDGVEFEGRQYHRWPPRDGAKVGEQYLVAYSNKNVKRSILLFDYPINQEGDFENYLKRFRVSPPRK